MSHRDIVTRFAPSPTGSLHVGGARTALYNWAFARCHGGTFILRLEDTDRARSTTAATREILAALTWLGIDWDEGPLPAAVDPFGEQVGDFGPYCQSQRLAIYDRYVEQLLAAEWAYEDDGAVRFNMPDTDITVHDVVLGQVTVGVGEIDDFVIRKTDGFPTYHLAVVVDDATMGVTHVIRGQEHLNNALKHRALQAALDLPVPVFAHLPLIFNPDGSKMSKRDKAKAARAAAASWIADHDGDEAAFWARILEQAPSVSANMRDDLSPASPAPLTSPAAPTASDASKVDSTAIAAFLARQSDDIHIAQRIAATLDLPLPEIDVEDFRTAGYLPDILCNYLALLGWNPGGDVERFDNEYLRQHFSLERIGKSNAKFDRAKLANFNQQGIAELPPTSWAERLFAFDARYGATFASAADPAFVTFAESYQVRSTTLADPARLGAFFFDTAEEIIYEDEKALAKVMLKNEGEGFLVLKEIRPVLAAAEPWTAEVLHATLESFATTRDLGMGKVAQPIRFAVSGGMATPPIDATLAILGREATLARIDRCLSLAPRVMG